MPFTCEATHFYLTALLPFVCCFLNVSCFVLTNLLASKVNTNSFPQAPPSSPMFNSSSFSVFCGENLILQTQLDLLPIIQ